MTNVKPKIQPLKGFLNLKYTIRVKTGLHIGGSKESIEIGGIDSPVVKLKAFRINGELLADVPYIPGSSLKGKIRSLLELSEGVHFERLNNGITDLDKLGEPCKCGECNICILFGTGGDNVKEPIRLRFSDFYPTEDTINIWKTFLGEVFTEMKTENRINRITSTAKDPRHTERVIAESEFEGTITFRIFENDSKELLETLKRGIELLEQDYLGGKGSRGYGRVEIYLDLSKSEWFPVSGQKENLTEEKLEEIFSKKEAEGQ